MPYLIEKESPGNRTRKSAFFDYFLVFVFIIYAGHANSFVEPLSFTKNPLGAFFPVVLCIIMALRCKVTFSPRFFLLLFGFAIYFVAISIKYKEIHLSFLFTYFYFFLLVYILVKSLGIKIFRIYEHLHFYLAVIGLGFWMIQIVLRGDTLFSILGSIPGIEAFSKVTEKGFNILLYSVQPSMASILYNFAIPRNCGYSWEPGTFAVYLCLAIFINLFFIEPDRQSKTRLWVLILALVSTQSTTGYFIFLVVIMTYFFNRQLNIIILVLPIAIIALIYIASLPFMSKKVINLIDDTKRIDMMLEDFYGSETAANPQRFTSLMITLVDFRNNPVLGIGTHADDGWTYKMGANISTISGIGNLMAQFGVVGFLFFIILTIKASLFFSKYFRYNSKFLLFFIMILISISYSILWVPMIMCFWMFQYISPNTVNTDDTELAEKAIPEKSGEN